MLASVTIIIRKSMKLSDLTFWASDVWFKNFLSVGCHIEGYWQFPRVGGKGPTVRSYKGMFEAKLVFQEGVGDSKQNY